MKIIIGNTYQDISKLGAEDLLEYLNKKSNPLLCTASGASPSGLYKMLVERILQYNIEYSSWCFVGLDEWMGMNGQDEGSCRYYLDKELFNPLAINQERICFFDGRTPDPHQECELVNSFIRQHNGIDVAILGLGMNGHIGMNEPGTLAKLHAHVAKIDPMTQQVGQKYFKEPREISTGLTLGIADLMEAKIILLVVSGQSKAVIAKRIIEEDISELLPATLLRNHPNFTIYLDNDAAQLIIQK
jgi:glucosamine-6-phosphate isomerase